MRIGLISDLHGNVPALESVLEELDVESIVCLGDLVGIGPDPAGVVDIVMKDKRIQSVRGNHDHNAAFGTSYGPIPDVRRRDHHRWVRSQLSEDQSMFLKNLPASIADGGIHFTHSHPDHIGPKVPYFERAETGILDDYYAGIEGGERLVAFGHTHVPLDVISDGSQRRYFNPGAVGAQNEGMAQYAIIDVDDGGIRIERRKTPYDIEWIRQEIRARGVVHAESIIRIFY
ncbi:MAG: metallophosphoesterase family protein [Candidatus Thermoplasmatota archaeon]|nr:metallophosphoesterase family protein [Candidatus Thermoplasmatota archaeon]